MNLWIINVKHLCAVKNITQEMIAITKKFLIIAVIYFNTLKILPSKLPSRIFQLQSNYKIKNTAILKIMYKLVLPRLIQ